MFTIPSFLKNKDRNYFFLAFFLCVAFFAAYTVLSFVRHSHYQSFGYDLGINDQVVWRYSTFQWPITTIAPFPDKTKLLAHVEFVYALIAPFYWIWSTRRMLLLLEAAVVCLGGLAMYLLARKRGVSHPVSFSILFSYLTFFGVQNAMWFDVHSLSFAAGFLAWFLYFLDRRKVVWTVVFFLLSITAKENIAIITLMISLIYFRKYKDTLTAFLSIASFIYLFSIFFIYFPFVVHTEYLYQNREGLFSNTNLLSFFDTPEKLRTIFYTLFSFGFIPLLNPFSLLPAFADLGTYFIIGSDLVAAQGLDMHYRVSLAPLLAWATIITINKFKKLDRWYLAVYLVLVACIIQYTLHLPLSYLTKEWFWTEPKAVKNIQYIRSHYLPEDASVVAQNNIVSHISQRDKVYSLYPEVKHFEENSPCGDKECRWFRWHGAPEFLFVDTSSEWDARHLLANREDFIEGLTNLEKMGVITRYKYRDTTVLYKVNKNPSDPL